MRIRKNGYKTAIILNGRTESCLSKNDKHYATIKIRSDFINEIIIIIYYSYYYMLYAHVYILILYSYFKCSLNFFNIHIYNIFIHICYFKDMYGD